MPVTRARVLEETWTADQIRNQPSSAVGSAVRAVAGSGGGLHRPVVAISTLPVLGNNRRRWQTSVYQVSNVLLNRVGNIEYAVVIREDWHQVICRRTLSEESGWSSWEEVIDLRSIAGDPFGEQVDDSHNTFSLGEDLDGNIHVWGNMHSDALRYARTTSAGDLATLTAFSPFTSNANLVTYPAPYVDGTGTLCLGWRNGYATSGDFFISRFVGGTWTAPLRILNGTASSQGAYPHNVAVSREGKLGLFFIWRGSGDASTNEAPSYIESVDNGATWRRADGTPVALPVTRATSPVILDVPVGSGLINQGGGAIDIDGNPHAGYQMYDADGNTQLYHFWHDGGDWHVDQVTDWKHRVETVAQTTLLLEVARVQTICTDAGRTYFITRTAHEGFNGAPIMIDVTPGADRTPFKLADMDLAGWEPAYDVPRFQRTGELTMLICSVAQVANSELNWNAQWLGVLTIDMVQIDSLQSGASRIPTIRVLRHFERSLQADAVGGVTDADIGRAVLPWGTLAAREIGKDAVLFARVTAFVVFETGSSAATLYLRERPSAGSLPTSDLAKIRIGAITPEGGTAPVGTYATPWEPLRNSPYVEANGARRDTWLSPRAVVDNAAGIEVRSYVLEIGVLDWS